MDLINLLPEDQRGAALESVLSQGRLGGIVPSEVANSFFTAERRLNPLDIELAAEEAGFTREANLLDRLTFGNHGRVTGEEAVDDIIGEGESAVAFDQLEDELIGFILDDTLTRSEIMREMARAERRFGRALHENALPLLLAMYDEDLSLVDAEPGFQLR
jgi:hypothetical protein